MVLEVMLQPKHSATVTAGKRVDVLVVLQDVELHVVLAFNLNAHVAYRALLHEPVLVFDVRDESGPLTEPGGAVVAVNPFVLLQWRQLAA